MGQRVDYEALPNTRYDQYVTKLQLLVSFLNGPEDGDFKAFRDFLRKNGLWEKDKAATMLSLVDISWNRKNVTMGPLARKIADSTNPEDIQNALFERLKDDNILLVKYVMEALDVDSGGRLHSVHELYRMITSYVYPGDYVTLTNFQSWIDWLAATGYIKLVGIRWALSEKGQRAVVELKGMDVEEILEDLEEAAEEAADEPGPSPADTMPNQKAATRTTQPAPRKSDGEEDWADLPPEPTPPSDADIAAAEAAFFQRFAGEPEAEEEAAPATASATPAAASAPAAAPMARPVHGGLHDPLTPAAFFPSPSVAGSSSDVEALAERIIAWWNVLGDWPVYTAPDLGVETGEGAAEGGALLLELATLALIVEGREPAPQVFAFVQRMRDQGFFDKIAGEGGFSEALAALGDVSVDPWTRPFIERLIHVPALQRRIAAAPELLQKVSTARSGREAVLALRESLVGNAWVEAPFWVLRELIRLGVADRPELASCAAVPTPRLLRNGYRIGLFPRAEAVSFAELVGASEAASKLFGPKAGYGEALEVMDRALS